MEARFENGIDGKSVVGTGFWVQYPCGKSVFITNHHNLDSKYLPDEFKPFSLKHISIELRDFSLSKFSPIPKMFSLSNYDLILSPNADVAIICNIIFSDPLDEFATLPLNAGWLADESFFDNYCGITQEVAFIGFPQGKYDEEGNLPIAGHAILASIPNRSFKSKLIKPDDVVLVDGRSFKGSSGSPVLTFPRGVSIGVDNGGHVNTGDYCPQRIVGIMSGHLYQEGKWISDLDIKREDFLNHSGKSFFTRSTSILSLFDVLKTKK